MGFLDFFKGLFSGIAAIGSAIVTFVKRIFNPVQQPIQEIVYEERPQIQQSRRYDNAYYVQPQPQYVPVQATTQPIYMTTTNVPTMYAAPTPAPMSYQTPVQNTTINQYYPGEMTWSENAYMKARRYQMEMQRQQQIEMQQRLQATNQMYQPRPTIQPQLPPNPLNVQYNRKTDELTWSDPVSRNRTWTIESMPRCQHTGPLNMSPNVVQQMNQFDQINQNPSGIVQAFSPRRRQYVGNAR
jgi:hypothetical protein